MPHLLVVDDSPTIRRMVKAALAPLGLQAVEAGSGLEAIEQLAVTPVNVMVLDLNMPDMHGLEVLGFVRANQKFHNIPIVVLTTRGDGSTREAAMRAGATRYLTKPFQPQALLDEVRQVLEATAQNVP